MDIRVDHHGSIAIIVPVSPAGQAWLDEHITDEEVQYWASGVVCEPRYVSHILDGMTADGLLIEVGV